ncbi:MAG: hypothetical protein V7756_18020 [Halopseudomonas sp.]|uniref:PHA/PHB synthase family protein n=1 Tax=Halopseudomonas sp. TaxID=2901191 RepID=UPI003001B9D4
MRARPHGQSLEGSLNADLSRSLLALLRTTLSQRQHHRSYLCTVTRLSLLALQGKLDTSALAEDRRFRLADWQRPLPRRLLQLWQAWQQPLQAWLDGLDVSPPERANLRWLLAQLSAASAPSNSLFNPQILDATLRTRGTNLRRGLAHLLTDQMSGRPLAMPEPGQHYRVGHELAQSRGRVVARQPAYELIHYAPSTPQQHSYPLLIIPPPINRFYLLDLTPPTSLVQHALSQGIAVYMMSWRNPNPSHCNWGLGHYVACCQQALQQALQLGDAAHASVLGVCSGGLLATLLAGWLQARGQSGCLSALSLFLTPLDSRLQTDIQRLTGSATRQQLRRQVWRQGYLDERSLGSLFTLMKPEQLLWAPAIERYALGQELEASPVSSWSHDNTRLPAQLVDDLLDLLQRDPLGQPGSLQINGALLDCTQVALPSWHLAAEHDHIVPWNNAYPGQRLGGDSVFTRCRGGHIQGLLCPPEQPRAGYLSAATQGAPTCEQWQEAAIEYEGSWWPAWTDWLKTHSGPQQAAIQTNPHASLGAAPGRYVHQL